MSRLNFPDPSGFPGGVIPKGQEHIENGCVFKFDSFGWTKQILSGRVVLDVNNISDDRLLPDPSNEQDKSRLKIDENGKWSGDNTIDGGTY